MTLLEQNAAAPALKAQRKSRAKKAFQQVEPTQPQPTFKLVAIRGGNLPNNGEDDQRNVSIERAVRGVKAALKSGHSRTVRPQLDNATAVRVGTREIYSREEIMVRMRFRALQLADAFYEKCMQDMAESSQLHYHMTGDNCVETWMPSSGAARVIQSMNSAANMLLKMAERAASTEDELVVALSSVTGSVK